MPKDVCPFCENLIEINIQSTGTFRVTALRPVDMSVPVYNMNGEIVYFIQSVYVHGICQKCGNSLRIPILYDTAQGQYIIKGEIERSV